MAKKTGIFIILIIASLFIICLHLDSIKKTEYNDCNSYIINVYRCASDVQPIPLESRLVDSSSAKALILNERNTGIHEGDHDGFEKIIQTHFGSYSYAGENIAYKITGEDEMFKAWFNSPKHKEIMLSKQACAFGYACVNEYCVLHVACK